MGLDYSLFTIRGYKNFVAEIKDSMSEDLDYCFNFVFPKLFSTVKWKYVYIVFKKKKCLKN